MSDKFGELKNVELKKIWASEPYDFTPWLAENIDKLGEIIGKDLEIIQTEYSVGGFSADIVANDLGSSTKVVIENQFGTSDHKHLGQIMLYCAGIKANCMVWIAENFRDEHKQTIEWLNSNTNDDIEFYAIGVKVIQIDNSKPVPLFDIVISPNKNISTNGGGTSSGGTDTQEAYKLYYQNLLDELREQYKFTNAKAGQKQGWYTFASEKSNVYKYYTAFASKSRVRTAIYIDTGDQTTNKILFDELLSEKDNIEKELGIILEWERTDEKRASVISTYRNGSINDDTEELSEIKNWVIKNLLIFKKVFPKYINKIIQKYNLR